MPATMAQRSRVTFDVPERVRRALNIVSARKGRSIGEILEEVAEQLFPEDLELADKAIAEDESAPEAKGRRKGKDKE